MATNMRDTQCIKTIPTARASSPTVQITTDVGMTLVFDPTTVSFERVKNHLVIKANSTEASFTLDMATSHHNVVTLTTAAGAPNKHCGLWLEKLLASIHNIGEIRIKGSETNDITWLQALRQTYTSTSFAMEDQNEAAHSLQSTIKPTDHATWESSDNSTVLSQANCEPLSSATVSPQPYATSYKPRIPTPQKYGEADPKVVTTDLSPLATSEEPIILPYGFGVPRLSLLLQQEASSTETSQKNEHSLPNQATNDGDLLFMGSISIERPALLTEIDLLGVDAPGHLPDCLPKAASAATKQEGNHFTRQENSPLMSQTTSLYEPGTDSHSTTTDLHVLAEIGLL